MGTCCPCPGEGLVTAAAGLAIAISKGMSADDMNTLGAFFTVLGDNLTLLATQRENQNNCCC